MTCYLLRYLHDTAPHFFGVKSVLITSLLSFNTSWDLAFISLSRRRPSWLWPRQTAPITNTSSNRAWRIIMLCCTKNTFAAAFTGQERWEAAFLLLAKPWYSCHILVESFLEKPNKTGRGENGEGRKRRGGLLVYAAASILVWLRGGGGECCEWLRQQSSWVRLTSGCHAAGASVRASGGRDRETEW